MQEEVREGEVLSVQHRGREEPASPELLPEVNLCL